MKIPKVGVLLGDRRQFYISKILLEEGYSVLSFEDEDLERLIAECEIIILPTPFEDRQALRQMRSGQLLFSANIPEKVKQELQARGLRVFDILEREEVAQKNAQISAEGVIAKAMRSYRGAVSLYQSNCLVLGYGRCGRAIAKRLLGLGAKVTLCSALEKERKEAKKEGCAVLSFEELPLEIKNQQFLFHTIPAPVLSRNCILECDPQILILDLVSKRSEEKLWAEQAGIEYIVCPKIPEKYAPRTAAMIFSEYIRKEISKLERGEVRC